MVATFLLLLTGCIESPEMVWGEVEVPPCRTQPGERIDIPADLITALAPFVGERTPWFTNGLTGDQVEGSVRIIIHEVYTPRTLLETEDCLIYDEPSDYRVEFRWIIETEDEALQITMDYSNPILLAEPELELVMSGDFYDGPNWEGVPLGADAVLIEATRTPTTETGEKISVDWSSGDDVHTLLWSW